MALRLHHDFTFLPDGRGRVRVRWSTPLGPGTPAPDEFVRSELQGAEGVDAWADVTCAPEGDELVFEATAWFPDAAALRFHCQGFHCNVLDFEVRRGDDGEVEVATRRDEQRMFEPPPARGGDAATRAWLAAERQKLEMARGFLASIFEGLDCSAVLRLPGELAEPVAGERLDANSAQFTFAGRSLVEVVDRLLRDDALMLELARAGDVTPDRALQRLGVTAAVALRTRGGAADTFDYDAEVAAARAAAGALVGTPQELPPTAVLGGPLGNPRIVAVKIVREAGGPSGLQPMGQNFAGLSLAVAGELDAQALRLDEARLEAVIAADGTDLTPEDEWNRRISFPKLGDDGRTVWFDVDLPLPPEGSEGLRELRGRLTVLQSSGESVVDLGFATFADGEPGTECGAVLVRCGEDDGTWRCEVQLQIHRDRIRAMLLQNGDETVEMDSRGYSACNDECTVEYASSVLPGPGARLCLRLADGLAPIEVPFEVGAVDWFGRPR